MKHLKSNADLAKRVKPEELQAIAAAVTVPTNANDIRITIVSEPGGKLPNGTPNGLGGRTQYAPVWVLDGRTDSAPIAVLDSPHDARDLAKMIDGPEGELWQRRERRRAIIQAEAEMAEAAEAAARLDAKAAAKVTRSMKKRGATPQEIQEATGGGSSRRADSSEKRTGRTRMRVEETTLSRLTA